MIDPHILRTKTHEVAILLKKRGYHFDADQFLTLEEQRKSLQIKTQQLQNARNLQSKAIGIAKSKGESAEALLLEVEQYNTELAVAKSQLELILQQIETIALDLPNLPDSSVPEGKDERDNVEISRWGQIPSFSFPPKAHDELGLQLNMLDFEMAAKITGSRFVVMRSQIARLHRALIQFMLDVHTEEHGYQEIYVPYIVNSTSMYATGQLPKLENDLFKLAGEQQYYLIPTAEIPVTNAVRDQILSVDALPVRYVCHTPCFRSEAGSYGKDTKGMIRQHQFEKVELLWITTPDTSFAALETLTSHAEAILKKLQLPYRVVNLCTGDLGNSSAKTYDLEVWLPSQNMYREISSCSNMTSFQARRLQARYRTQQNDVTAYLHTLNGSGLAVGRTLVALLENYQTEAGDILVPEVLRSYLGGLERIS